MRPIVEWNNGSAFGVHLWSSVLWGGSIFANVVDTSGVNHYFSSDPGIFAPQTGFHHVALTYDKATGNAFIYLDGIQVGYDVIINITPQTSYDLYLGARVSGTPPYFLTGYLDEVSVYNRALTPIEVANIYSSFGYGKCSQ